MLEENAPEPAQDMIPDALEEASEESLSSSSSSSASSSDSDQEADISEDPALLRWITPQRSRVLHLVVDGESARPYCRRTPFKGGDPQIGLADAIATGLPWHDLCLRHLPAKSKQFLADEALRLRPAVLEVPLLPLEDAGASPPGMIPDAASP
jgi:hypothetical protein